MTHHNFSTQRWFIALLRGLVGQVYLCVLLCAVLGMHSLGTVHAVVHNQHAEVHQHAPLHEHAPDFLHHKPGSLACLGFDAVSTALGPLLVLLLGFSVGLHAKPVVWFRHDPTLAFLFIHPPAARAPPWF